MSLLLIVLLLDGSHLELVEDVLKEINFNNKDCYKLRKELRVHVEQQGENMLKQCLRKWLRSGATSYSWRFWNDDDDPPTLYGLATALKSIGYRGASEYIIKTCRLIIMFNDQCYTSILK